MDEDKFTDILAILLKEDRTDLVDYIKKLIEYCDFDFELSDDEDTDSDIDDSVKEEISVNIDNNGFHSLN